ncbi:hypothetical protein ABTZ78_17040 [Streptomyces bauhiniae]|uniref:hypothetical protein n=1 Tax=Streptomyces bauhiniae TaxID=2340725 RepID=UPI00331AD920
MNHHPRDRMAVLTRADIAAHIRAGHHDQDIVAALKVTLPTVTAVRRQLHYPASRARGFRPETVDDAFWGLVRHLPDGHVLWLGDTDTLHGIPVFDKIEVYGARGYAFEKGHGRPPVGVALPICGNDRCVAYNHLADHLIRAQLSYVLTALFGGTR